MAKKIETLPVDELVQGLLHETIDINTLNLERKSHRDAFLKAVEQRHGLLDNITNENAKHFLTYLLSVRPNDFIYIKKEHYTND